MKIGFHSNQLGIRGTEVALYDYALGNQEILGNESIIFAPKNSDLTTYDKFSKKLPVYLYDNFEELEEFGLDWCYFIKYGTNDGKLLKSAKNFVHAVFNVNDPHGDVYAYVSEWLGELHTSPFLPHIVHTPPNSQDFRQQLGIPKDAVVFGRYGGYDQFDYDWVKNVIETIVKENSHIYFIFLNTQSFIQHPQVFFFGGTDDINKKTAFINTCDAMLHARSEGESFGLSICEFLAQNKPVITNPKGRDKNHVRVLGDKGIYYTNTKELYNILTGFIPKKGNYSHLIDAFSPEKVMNKFNNLINDL
jgi:hypothetical protein